MLNWLVQRYLKNNLISGYINIASEQDKEYGNPLIVRAGEYRIRIDYTVTGLKVTAFDDRGFKVIYLGDAE